MKLGDWRWIVWLKKLLSTQQPEPTRQAESIVAMQLQIVLPAKIGVIAVVVSYLYHSGWLFEAPSEVPSPHWIAIELLQRYFPIYIGCIAAAAVVFMLRRRFPPGFFQWVVFILGLLDGLFMGGLTFITGGFESIAFWIFPGLIVLNAISIPLATPQIVLNLLLSVFYLSAGLLYVQLPVAEYSTPSPEAFRQFSGARLGNHRGGTNAVASATNQVSRPTRRTADLSVGAFSSYNSVSDENPTEPVLPKIFVLWLLTVCCYGVQVLAARQRQVFEEERESAVREAQLHSAGRLAAEFAHQIKNPLAIINNAAFSVQRALKDGRGDVSRQIKIIQEEVERSDKIVTQLMGYAQLSEGHVEKLNVAEELDYAVEQVFPPAVESGVRLDKHYLTKFPTLLMQRRHFQDAVVNLLQNAREAVNGGGEVSLFAICRPDSSIEITVNDNGPGIPPDKLGRIFEAYYSTKEKGTGLGLAIVKHNVELYAGTVRVESELGKGARFVLTFPAKTVINLG
jgi:nitrogen-specific signal transduction histidine kinase